MSMKKNILIIGLASIFGIASGLISCSPDYETEFKVETLVVPDKSQAPITFPLLGGEHEIEVQTNVPLDRWSAQSNAEWCKVVQHEGKVVVSASANNIYKQRRAEITVAYGHQSYSITVSQFGKEPAILIGDKLQQEGYVEIIALYSGKRLDVCGWENGVNIVWNTEVKALQGDDRLTGLVLRNKVTGEESTLPVDGLFVAVGRRPETALFRGQLETDEAGYLIETTRTSLPGVYAVGDVRRKPVRQILTAAADGAVAAHYIEEYLAGNRA